ncbi:hypothetical protein BH708_15510 [Brachybacterium sp. P6-10-X1]|uniref:hypothetical protein n=1 Tax=Brachybacterium sp. P6-10-X1 TaxID=1903186 RepID=UPI000971BB6D|nr:hypothetical protein [Brachybacterium sp. P6-10-X1]APX33884.1 hypothetical protein BH708_15510 [Brachybacterium sp. P6-10-X1]
MHDDPEAMSRLGEVADRIGRQVLDADPALVARYLREANALFDAVRDGVGSAADQPSSTTP